MARDNRKTAAAKNESSKAARFQAPPKQPNQDRRALPLLLQQKCLDVFRNALEPQDRNSTVLQEVKGHLYNRHFAQAFGKREYLQVYAARWSPSRALSYLQIIDDLSDHLFASRANADTDENDALDICCVGGGAGAELVAIGIWIARQENLPLKSVNATFVDIADWETITSSLYDAITKPPELSKYASAAAKEANAAFVDPKLYQSDFQQMDILHVDEQDHQKLLAGTDVVTLMFTLNELYTTSILQTQQMLARLTAALRPGSLLLVVDSPGSYSAVSINGTEKKYPMQWLLDYTLIGAGQKQKHGGNLKWEKLVSDDSRWFRLPQGLQYPIELENMRYQIHLYRRLDNTG